MRVALVHSFYGSDVPSGENAQVDAEYATLRAAGVDVRLFAARTDETRAERFYRLHTGGTRVATGYGASPLAAIEAFRPDVVHVHNLFPNFGRRWIEQVAVPVVATVHNYRFTCAQGALFRDGQLCTDCPSGRRWAGVRHRCYRGSATASVPLAIAQRRGASGDPVLARADRILVLSTRQRAMLEDGGVPRERLVDWANFLPADLEAADGEAHRRRAGGGSLYVGRLVHEKGCLELVRAWPGDRPLHVVGDGPLLPHLRREAVGKAVELTGSLPRAGVVALMRASDALLIPRMAPEPASAPLVYIEALAAGLPTVATRASDVGSRVEGDGCGVAVDSVIEMAVAVERVRSDPLVRRRCRTVFERWFSPDVWTKRILDLYRSIT